MATGHLVSCTFWEIYDDKHWLGGVIPGSVTWPSCFLQILRNSLHQWMGSVISVASHDNFSCLLDHWHIYTDPCKQTRVGPAARDKVFSRKRLRVVLKAGCWVIGTLCSRDECQVHCRDKIQHGQSHNYAPLFCLGWRHYVSLLMALFIALCVSLPGPCWMFSTNVITSQSPMRSAREGEGESAQKDLFILSALFFTF